MSPIELERIERFKFHLLCGKEKGRILSRLKAALMKEKYIILAVIHGSFPLDQPFRDVDVAVYLHGEVDPLDFKLKLDDRLSRELGYPIDVRLLNDAPPNFIINVLERGEILIEKIEGLMERIYLKPLDEELFLSGKLLKRG